MNAYEFSKKESVIHVDVFEDEGNLVMSIRNVHNENENLDEIKKIFNSFYQAHQGYNRLHQGLGLGLSITKSFVDFLGGKIYITKDNDANVFIASLPMVSENEDLSFGEELDSFIFD